MEWTYCLNCGAQQLPGCDACPACAPPQDDVVSSVSAADEVTHQPLSVVIRSIWLAQVSAALGGLLFALGIGYCIGYASRVWDRKAPPPVASLSPPQAVEPVAFASSALPPAPLAAREPLLMTAGTAWNTATATAGLMGPPAPDRKEERVSEFWTAPLPRTPVHRKHGLPEVLAPRLQLYGRQFPDPPSVWVYLPLETPPEWQGSGIVP